MYKYVLLGFLLKEKIRRKMVLFLGICRRRGQIRKMAGPRTKRFGKISLIMLYTGGAAWLSIAEPGCGVA